MGTNCAPLIADLFLLCYQRDIKASLSDDKQAVARRELIVVLRDLHITFWV